VRNRKKVLVVVGAGALYALIVFLIGFILGTGRVLMIAPLLGETAAVGLEAPVMLVASWFVCRWCVDRLDVPRRVGNRSLIGVVAFGVLIAAEFALGALAFENPPPSSLAATSQQPERLASLPRSCSRRRRSRKSGVCPECGTWICGTPRNGLHRVRAGTRHIWASRK
jgi:hypothetical protein